MESELLEIGLRIKAPRISRGLTLSVLTGNLRAKYGVKIDAGYLSKIENGKAEIPLRTLFAIADYFEIRPSQLLGKSQAHSEPQAEVPNILNNPALVENVRALINQVGEDQALQCMQSALSGNLRMVRESNPHMGEVHGGM